MSTPHAPRTEDFHFLLFDTLQAGAALRAMPRFGTVDDATLRQVMEEAARFAGEKVAPLQRVGDVLGCRFDDGRVTAPPGFRDAYQAFRAAGWPSLACEPEDGGQGLPGVLEAVLYDMLSAANHAWTMAPGLLRGAYDCLRQHGSEALRREVLPRLASGEWLATMALTEPQAGSDLGLIRTRAQPDEAHGDDLLRFRTEGTKIFVSGAEHDLCDNIVHLVLARLPESPAGSRGLSLFLVPRLLADGTANGVHCERIEDKMGLHGSPTCVLRFEDARGALVGQAHQGLQAMFAMMNAARLHVAVQGIGLLDAAWQKAQAYSQERLQMRAPVRPDPAAPADPIALHPAIRRILDTQRGWIDGARLLALRTGIELDAAQHHPDAGRRASAQRWCALVTPVLKAACSAQAFAGASECLQVLGGHGYMREWGMEQIVRDARATLVYEGTNEIQAIDLLVRKVLPDGGAALSAALLELRDGLDAAVEGNADVLRRFAQLRYLTTSLALAARDDAVLPYEVADDFLRLCALALMAWAWCRIEAAAAPGDARWHSPCIAFRRWAMPEFEMRLAIVKSAMERSRVDRSVD